VEQIDWLADLDKARRLAGERDKPVLLFFHSPT